MTSAPGRRMRGFASALAVVFAVLMVGGAGGVLWWWGVGFDEAETLGVASRSTDAAMVASFWTAATALVGLLVIASRATFRRARS